MTLLEKYNCKDFAELREKYMNGEAQELTKIIRDLTLPQKSTPAFSISCASSCVAFVEKADVFGKELEGDEIGILFASAKGNPIGHTIVNANTNSYIEELSEATKQRPASSCFIFYGVDKTNNSYRRDEAVSRIKDALNFLEIRVLDSFHKDFADDYWFSSSGTSSVMFYDRETENDIIAISNEYKEVLRKYELINQYDDLVDFMEYDSLEMIKGLNVINDTAHIAEALRRGYMNMPYEVSVCLFYDENYNINNIYLSRGSTSAALVNRRIPLNYLSSKSAVGFWFNHNHPSGVSTPSLEDQKIKDSYVEHIGDKFFASTIVAHDGVHWDYRIEPEKLPEKISMKEESKTQDRMLTERDRIVGKNKPSALEKKAEERSEKVEKKETDAAPSIHSILASMSDNEKVL